MQELASKCDQDDGNASEKRKYEAPRLTQFGSFADVTRGTGFEPGDDGETAS